MKKQLNHSTGISGCTIELTLAEMIVLKNTASVLTKENNSKINYHSLQREKEEASKKLSVFIDKVTEGVQGLDEAESALFLTKEQEDILENEMVNAYDENHKP